MINHHGQSLLSIRQLSRQDIEGIFSAAQLMEPISSSGTSIEILNGKILANLFFQASTRTRFSFECAMLRLGGRAIACSSADECRAGTSWGETLADTARVIGTYADVVVMRHPHVGAVAEFAEHSPVPVINGGNGVGPGSEHPSQVLVDLYTTWKEFGRLDGLSFLIVGGLQLRVAHSLARALTNFSDVHLYLACPNRCWWSADEERELAEAGLKHVRVERVEDAMDRVDVIYQNGLTEGHHQFVPEEYRITAKKLTRAKENSIVLHPLPRDDDLCPDVDSSPHARYFNSAANGVPVRMALLAAALGRLPDVPR